jgi:hypothetical protein
MDMATPTSNDAAKTAKGRPRKYGDRCGSVTDLAESFRDLAQTFSVMLYGKQRDVLAYDQVFMLKNLRCPVRVVWVFRKTQWVAFFTTDLTLSVTQIIEYYGARWKIEAGFKEIKQMEWMPPPTGPAAGRFGRASRLIRTASECQGGNLSTVRTRRTRHAGYNLWTGFGKNGHAVALGRHGDR